VLHIYIVSLIFLGGYFRLVLNVFHCSANIAPWLAMATLMIMEFFFGLLNQLTLGTQFIIVLGYGLFFMYSISWLTRPKLWRENVMSIPSQPFFWWAVAAWFSLCYVQGLFFTVVDEFSYWGVIGKYIYWQQHLPRSDHILYARHLFYTPGMGLFHNIFYSLFREYTEQISFYSQNLLLLASLLVVIKPEQIKQTVILYFLLLLLLMLFFGSVLAKLTVDYLLAAQLFAMLWYYFNEKSNSLGLFLPLLLALYLIKQVGLLLSTMLLILFLVDSWQQRQKKLPIVIISISLIAIVLFHFLWDQHCENYQFHSYLSTPTWHEVCSLLWPVGEPAIYHGWCLFLKAITVGKAGSVNLPYYSWWIVLIVMAGFFYRQTLLQQQSRVQWLFSLGLLFFLLYLVMIYYLEVRVLGVGQSSSITLAVDRYVNIVFVPFILLSLAWGWDHCVTERKLTIMKSCGVILLIVGTMLIFRQARAGNTVFSRIKVAATAISQVTENTHQTICVWAKPFDHLPELGLNYFLMPTMRVVDWGGQDEKILSTPSYIKLLAKRCPYFIVSHEVFQHWQLYYLSAESPHPAILLATGS